MWVEVVVAFLVEGYRELMEWWQTRAFFRPRTDSGALPVDASATGAARADVIAEAVDSVLAAHARKHVGMALGVWWQGESWVFARGRIREASAAHAVFEIGSVTKVFTATLLADMADDGLVALDDPVQRHLPERVELPVRGRPMTLADLATHSSGLPRLPPGLLRRSLRQRRDPYAGFTDADLERAVTRVRLKASPGDKLRYSNFGFGLLGFVLARRGGRGYEELVRERIGDPLGLVDTSISVRDGARFAEGHDRRGRPVPHWDLAALAGAGGLRSSVADLLRFLALQHEPATTRLSRAAFATQAVRVRRGQLGQCLGWVRLPLRGATHEMHWHNGGTAGFRSFVGFVREREIGVAVLSNCSRSVDAIGFRLLETLSRA